MELTRVAMIEFIVLNQQQEDGEANRNNPASQKLASAAHLCIARPISELNLPKTCQMEFFDPDDLMNFKLVICPEESFYRNGRFMVNFRAHPNYLHEPPKAKCATMIRHANTDMDGNSLNLLNTCQVEFPDPDDQLNFKMVICPGVTFYQNGRFMFNFRISPNCPHEPSKVKSDTTLKDRDGDVCLNIAGEDWKPVLAANSIV